MKKKRTLVTGIILLILTLIHIYTTNSLALAWISAIGGIPIGVMNVWIGLKKS
ncbi:hypothetical protein [Pontibacillus salipaludis]|uniref:hypothetical protein n=1 Tax=Pontibacillus salipaludis TaxID=1697394 RepID=UPI0031EA261A